VNGGVINDSSSAPVLVATQTGTNYYFGRKLIKNGGSQYTFGSYVVADRLGSIGKFYPYGQEKPSATTNGTEKFTGYFRDSETGLDYADQRFHNPGTGRFLTPDWSGLGIDPSRPGSWNLYSYVEGDPINHKDASGLELADDPCDPNSPDYDPYDAQCPGPGGGGGPGGGCVQPNPFTPSRFRPYAEIRVRPRVRRRGEADARPTRAPRVRSMCVFISRGRIGISLRTI
jgi:RHS repeat-associated protein